MDDFGQFYYADEGFYGINFTMVMMESMATAFLVFTMVVSLWVDLKWMYIPH